MTNAGQAITLPSPLSLEQTVAVLVDELRQPLAAITEALEVQKRSLSPERRQRAGEVIAKHVHDLSRLLEAVGEVSWTQTLLACERVDACEIIRAVVDLSDAAVRRRGHTVTSRLPSDAVWVLGDAPRLKQLFADLLQNAVAYTPEGGHISVTLARDADAVSVRIKDDGVGIPAEWLDSMFDLFRSGIPQASGTRQGIGLSLVRRLVRLHGGSVAAHSEGPGRGNEFVVTLPSASASPNSFISRQGDRQSASTA